MCPVESGLATAKKKSDVIAEQKDVVRKSQWWEHLPPPSTETCKLVREVLSSLVQLLQQCSLPLSTKHQPMECLLEERKRESSTVPETCRAHVRKFYILSDETRSPLGLVGRAVSQ